MSGAGRKHRAKHLTRQYLDSSAWLGLVDGEQLGVCVEPPHGGHVLTLLLEATRLDADGGSVVVSEPQEKLIVLPGKFNKVMWLRVRDVLVVRDNAVLLKPSPEQLANFLKDPSHAMWATSIEKAQVMADERRRDVERAPLQSNATTTTTSVLPGARAPAPPIPQPPSAHDDESLDNFVNPNRMNLKHREQYFFGVDDDEEEEEEENC